MSETLALSKKIQSRFTKKVKNVKDKISKGVIKLKEDIKTPKSKKFYGLIYIGHLPHGFYEEEMKQYFKQFGVVTNVRVCRSSKTGRSKGYGFVQFREPEVAKIAAETMDNYLMFNRRLICKYIPPEKQRRTLFRGINWSVKHYPLKFARKEHLKKRNKNLSDEKYARNANRMLDKLKKKMDALKELGVQHVITPRNIPDDMKHLLQDHSAFEIHNTNTTKEIREIRNGGASGFKVTNIPGTGVYKKSLKTIKKKKDQLKKSAAPKLSFMQSERLKRLAAVQVINEVLVKKVNKLKKGKSK